MVPTLLPPSSRPREEWPSYFITSRILAAPRSTVAASDPHAAAAPPALSSFLILSLRSAVFFCFLFFHCLLSISLSFSLLSLCVYLLFLQRGPLVLSSFLISRCYNFPFVFPASLSLSLDSYYFLYPLLLLRRVPLFYFSYVFTVLF